MGMGPSCGSPPIKWSARRASRVAYLMAKILYSGSFSVIVSRLQKSPKPRAVRGSPDPAPAPDRRSPRDRRGQETDAERGSWPFMLRLRPSGLACPELAEACPERSRRRLSTNGSLAKSRSSVRPERSEAKSKGLNHFFNTPLGVTLLGITLQGFADTILIDCDLHARPFLLQEHSGARIPLAPAAVERRGQLIYAEVCHRHRHIQLPA